MTRCDGCRRSLGRCGHGWPHSSAVWCADCEHRWRKGLRLAEQKAAELAAAQRRREREVARKVQEWRAAA